MNDLRLEEARWTPVDIGKTWEHSWKKFSSNPMPWILSSLVYTCAMFVLMGIYMVGVFSLASTSPESGALYDPAAPPASSPAPGIGFIIFVFFIVVAMGLLSVMWMLNTYRCAIEAIHGRDLKVGSFFSFAGFGGFFAVNFVVGIVVMLGIFLCIIPGYIAAFMLGFAPLAALNLQQPSVGKAFTASIDMVKRNPLASILAILFSQVINAVGGMVVIGSVFTVPLTALFLTYAFRGSLLGDPAGVGGTSGFQGFGGPAPQEPPYPPYSPQPQQPPYPPQAPEPPYPPQAPEPPYPPQAPEPPSPPQNPQPPQM